MIKVAFVNPDTGLVAYTATPSDDVMYMDGAAYGNVVAHVIPFESNDTEVLHTWHWTGIEFATHQPNPNPVFVWDAGTFEYKEPDNYLEMVRVEVEKNINRLAGNKISAVYPQYKQANMTARAVELISINQVGSEEWQGIQASWDWVKAVRDASNVANSAVNQSATVADIRTIEQDFKNTIALF